MVLFSDKQNKQNKQTENLIPELRKRCMQISDLRVQGQPGPLRELQDSPALHRETLSWKTKTQK